MDICFLVPDMIIIVVHSNQSDSSVRCIVNVCICLGIDTPTATATPTSLVESSSISAQLGLLLIIIPFRHIEN